VSASRLDSLSTSFDLIQHAGLRCPAHFNNRLRQKYHQNFLTCFFRHYTNIPGGVPDDYTTYNIFAIATSPPRLLLSRENEEYDFGEKVHLLSFSDRDCVERRIPFNLDSDGSFDWLACFAG
jgi:hypothetical protein